MIANKKGKGRPNVVRYTPLVLQILHHIISQVLNRFEELLGFGLCREAVHVHDCDSIAEILQSILDVRHSSSA